MLTPEQVIDLAATHHVASESPLFNQCLVDFARAIEQAARREALTAALEIARKRLGNFSDVTIAIRALMGEGE